MTTYEQLGQIFSEISENMDAPFEIFFIAIDNSGKLLMEIPLSKDRKEATFDDVSRDLAMFIGKTMMAIGYNDKNVKDAIDDALMAYLGIQMQKDRSIKNRFMEALKMYKRSKRGGRQ